MSAPVAALTTRSVDDAIFHVASALQVPVLVLALVALAVVIYQFGAYLIEVFGRRGRSFPALLDGTARAHAAIATGDRATATSATGGLARSGSMAATLALIVAHAGAPESDPLLNKALADFDLNAQKRLGVTRMLVRFGPALGLMGTLIPLSPALTGLANGNTSALSHDLRIAFSVTVLGLLVGAVAFGLSLSRDRMYSQDLSDLQYLAAIVSDPRPT